jgi:AraC-like DNA-binding protein
MNPGPSVRLQHYVYDNFKSSDLILPGDEETAVILMEEGTLTLRDKNRSTIIKIPSLTLLSRSSIDISLFGSAYLLRIKTSLLSELLQTPYARGVKRLLQPIFTEKHGISFTLRSEQSLQLKQSFNRISRELKEQDRDSDAVLQLSVLEILIQTGRFKALRAEEQSFIEKTSVLWSVQETIAYIHEHYDQPLSLEDLAGRCGFNPSYFSRVFKEESGTALFEYINRLRIKGACLLLRNSNMSILEIAFAVGYNNVSFFNRYFKRIHLMSPGQYRKKIRQE